MKRRIMQVSVLLATTLFFVGCKMTNLIDSRVYVPEEGGINFVKVTDENTDQFLPTIRKVDNHLSWWANPYFAITKDGQNLAYLCTRNEKSNIFVRQLSGQGGALQRTFSDDINDVAYSPDGKTLCFSRRNGNYNLLFTTSATQHLM